MEDGDNMLRCLYCDEDDFDELGLEIHLACYCLGDQSPKLNSVLYRVNNNGVIEVEKYLKESEENNGI